MERLGIIEMLHKASAFVFWLYAQVKISFIAHQPNSFLISGLNYDF